MVEISRPAMTQSRLQDRFQFSQLPSPTHVPGRHQLQGGLKTIFGGKSSLDINSRKVFLYFLQQFLNPFFGRYLL